MALVPALVHFLEFAIFIILLSPLLCCCAFCCGYFPYYFSFFLSGCSSLAGHVALFFP